MAIEFTQISGAKSSETSETILQLDSIATDFINLTQGESYTRNGTEEEISFFNDYITRINNGEKLSGFYSKYDDGTITITAYFQLNSLIIGNLIFNVLDVQDETLTGYRCVYYSDSGSIAFTKTQVYKESGSSSSGITKVEASFTYDSTNGYSVPSSDLILQLFDCNYVEVQCPYATFEKGIIIPKTFTMNVASENVRLMRFEMVNVDEEPTTTIGLTIGCEGDNYSISGNINEMTGAGTYYLVGYKF